MPQIQYDSKLNQGSVITVYSSFMDKHTNVPHIRRVDASFGAILRGSVLMKTQQAKEVTAKSGDVIYIPNGIICDTFWSGTPEIEYFSLHLYGAAAQSLPSWALQRLSPEITGTAMENIKKIHELLSTGEAADRFRALSRLYGFLADIDGQMHIGSGSSLPSALLYALRYIEEHFRENIPISKLAAECYISESSLYHMFRSELGTTPNFYHISYRIDAAATMLRQCSLSLDEIAEAVGFSSASYFCEMFKKLNGMAPGAYRRVMGSQEKPEKL